MAKTKNFNSGTIIVWLIIGVIIIFLYGLANYSERPREIDYSGFIEMVKGGSVREAVIDGQEINFKDKSGNSYRTIIPEGYTKVVDILQQHNVRISAKKKSEGGIWSILFSWLPLIILIVLWFMFMKQMQTGGNKAFSFGKSKAKLFTSSDKKVTFDDVAGVEEAKEELKDIVEFLKNPKRFSKLGGRMPRGVLLVGPPGTGKTLLAKAVAGEANVPFLSISGSDFVELFVGVGASRVRDLFDQASRLAPCVIFIDEIDAVGRQRGAGLGGGHDEREQTLNQLLVEMDGFDPNEGIIVLAATNRPDILDPALLRPGRFDRTVFVPKPDVRGREEILKVHVRNLPLADNVDLRIIARGTPGLTGADLANLVNEAALIAARKNKDLIEMEDFEEAKDKILMGKERKSMILSDEEKKLTAYHEAGHALLASLLPHADPIHKVTIIPRGLALGVTQQLPEDDRYTYTREYLEDQIAVLLGGRASEEIMLGKITTGAGSDLERATELARRMVCEWGMSDLGPLNFGEKEGAIFLGKSLSMKKEISEETARKIDREIEKIVTRNYERARKLIVENKEKLENIARSLLEKEVLTSEEINAIINAREAAYKGEDKV
ncbi:MAG: ATP-dependent zinc metalloprotease FtsH [Candidatus Aminicenantes bacterium]|nr:ATP-dependent zinc metalloprotease FtsH [Candidatus Aminicenantes bacterium]